MAFVLEKKIAFFDPENPKKQIGYTLEFFDKNKDYHLSIVYKNKKMDYFCDCQWFALRGTAGKPCKHLKECMTILGLGGKNG